MECTSFRALKEIAQNMHYRSSDVTPLNNNVTLSDNVVSRCGFEAASRQPGNNYAMYAHEDFRKEMTTPVMK